MADQNPTNRIDSYRPKPHMTEAQVLKAFQDATSSFPQSFDRRASSYSSVTVFIVTWDGDHDRDWYEVEMKWTKRMADVFSKTYLYNVERVVLLDKDINPQDTLLKTIQNVTANKTEADLVIFVYSGHGKQGETDYRSDRKDLPEHMKTELREEAELLLCGMNNYLPFNPLRKQLFDNAIFDVLIIMDCCYASTAAIGQTRKELIAACPVGSTAPTGERGLLANICQILEHAAAEHEVLSTCQLYTSLLERAFCLHPDKNPILRETPIHTNLNPFQVPIILAPLAEGKFTQRNPAMVYGPGQVRAVLSVNLESNEQLSKYQLRQAIEGFKSQIRGHVQVSNVFQTKSALVIFETTTDLWYCLQPHPAIELLALERPESPRKIEPPNTILAHEVPAYDGSQTVLAMRPAGNVPEPSGSSNK